MQGHLTGQQRSQVGIPHNRQCLRHRKTPNSSPQMLHLLSSITRPFRPGDRREMMLPDLPCLFPLPLSLDCRLDWMASARETTWAEEGADGRETSISPPQRPHLMRPRTACASCSGETSKVALQPLHCLTCPRPACEACDAGGEGGRRCEPARGTAAGLGELVADATEGLTNPQTSQALTPAGFSKVQRSQAQTEGDETTKGFPGAVLGGSHEACALR